MPNPWPILGWLLVSITVAFILAWLIEGRPPNL